MTIREIGIDFSETFKEIYSTITNWLLDTPINVMIGQFWEVGIIFLIVGSIYVLFIYVPKKMFSRISKIAKIFYKIFIEYKGKKNSETFIINSDTKIKTLFLTLELLFFILLYIFVYLWMDRSHYISLW